MEQASDNKPRRRGAGRVAFLAHKETIQRLVNEGHSKTLIYEELGDKLGITYAQFTRHIKTFLPSGTKVESVTVPRQKVQQTEPPKQPALPSEPQGRPIFQKGERNPSKESLI